MRDRRALIVDNDDEFTQWAGQCLRQFDFSVDVAVGRREALAYLDSHDPAIVFLAVERPKKRGFVLFSDVKRKLKQVPIILVTSTVSTEEMLLHQKLRLHGDAYLDKRDLTEIDLLTTLDRLLQLGHGDAELVRIAEVVSRTVTPTESRADAELRALDSELAALLVETRADSPVAAVDDDDADDEVDGSDSYPDDDADELRRQLEAARRAASSSPFSADYLKLSDRAERVEHEVGRLRDSAARRSRQIEALRTKLVETAARLVESERKRAQSVKRASSLEERLAVVQRDLERSFEEERDRWALERKSHQVELETQREELLRVEGEAAAARDSEWRTLLSDLQRRHEQLLASRDEQLKNESVGLQRTLSDDLARKEQEFEERLRRREDEHRQELSSECETWRRRFEEEKGRKRSELASAESSHRQQVERLEAQNREELQAVRRSHETERDRLRSEHGEKLQELERRQERSLRGCEEAWQKKLEEALASHARERSNLSRDHQREITRLTAENEQALREADRQREAAVARAVAKTRREMARNADEDMTRLDDVEEQHRAQIAELERQHTEEIAVLERSHADEIERLRLHQETERERLRTERNAALDEFSEKLRGDQQEMLDARQAEWQDKLDQLQREHERTLASNLEEIRMLSEALDAVRREEPGQPEKKREGDVQAADFELAEIETPKSRLRRLVAELDRIGPEQNSDSSVPPKND